MVDNANITQEVRAAFTEVKGRSKQFAIAKCSAETDGLIELVSIGEKGGDI